MACLLRHRALRLQRQRDTSLPKYLIHRSHGIQHLGEPDERRREIHHLTKLFGRNPHIECRPGMGLQLRKRLHRSKGDAGYHLALFQGKVSRLEHLTENKLLQHLHHLGVRTLSGQGLTAK